MARDGVAAWLATAKESGEGDIVIFASHTLWNALLAQGLIDELHLMVAPVAYGGGTPAFESLGRPHPGRDPPRARLQQRPAGLHAGRGGLSRTRVLLGHVLVIPDDRAELFLGRLPHDARAARRWATSARIARRRAARAATSRSAATSAPTRATPRGEPAAWMAWLTWQSSISNSAGEKPDRSASWRRITTVTPESMAGNETLPRPGQQFRDSRYVNWAATESSAAGRTASSISV